MICVSLYFDHGCIIYKHWLKAIRISVHLSVYRFLSSVAIIAHAKFCDKDMIFFVISGL